MSRVRSAKDIDVALQKKGFACKSDGKHIRYFFLLPDGTKAGVNTLMSHGMGGSTIGDPLLGRMARQLLLTKAQFLDLVDCTLDEAGYRAILDKTEGR